MTWVEAIRKEDLPADTGFCLVRGEDRVALFAVGDEVFAVGDRCSHAEASLAEGILFGAEVECPRHGASFDLATGKALTLPASLPVPTYPVRIDDGTVFVELGDE